ncbi:deoxyhypusine synthase, partial [Candidatus Micrarchaeota archaeon]|nr:deoxyhypusine synthase [Candidatus Micrarchaeota archaeon]MBU1929988.1 deoxyhypusine synthase [Candidatus Micrarchaeota archaeon]
MEIKDINPEKICSTQDLLEQFSHTGFQATHLSQALSIIEEMKKQKATILLGFTANLVASGLRGLITELCQKKFVDGIVTTAGSIDHDVIKSHTPYQEGSFFSDDSKLHEQGLNRIGNILIPSSHFEWFEQKMQGTLKELFQKQKVFSPAGLCNAIGKTLNESSFLYWCSKNNIPVFCPGITDGAIGLQSYFFKQNNPEFGIDVTQDMKQLADLVLNAEKTGGIILGGGISKHHIIGANLLRDGLDFAVYVTTASEYDGSLSGAQTHEAKSWG